MFFTLACCCYETCRLSLCRTVIGCNAGQPEPISVKPAVHPCNPCPAVFLHAYLYMYIISRAFPPLFFTLRASQALPVWPLVHRERHVDADAGDNGASGLWRGAGSGGWRDKQELEESDGVEWVGRWALVSSARNGA